MAETPPAQSRSEVHDSAAIERAVQRLEELNEATDVHVARALEQDDWPHYIVREVLRAAGESWPVNERQAVLDVINIYGDETLHKALDAIGWPERWGGRFVVIIGSSRYAAEIAAVARKERSDGLTVETPDFTNEQPTDIQIERWKRAITDATEVILVVGADFYIGEHVRAELEHAQREEKPIRLMVQT